MSLSGIGRLAPETVELHRWNNEQKREREIMKDENPLWYLAGIESVLFVWFLFLVWWIVA